ncbi:MAG: LptA/OstA family protein, partial [Candidatus Omnitrophota bacterium]|nr:LptA/OstA family protein [Candidatus Omnitrophota bacterium]
MKRIILLVSLLFLLFYNISYAQESQQPIEVNGDQVEYFPKEKKVVGVGNISVDYQDTILTCDKISVNTETKDAEAEGNVVLKSKESHLFGERIIYNFSTKKGKVLKAKVKAGDWYSGGEELEILSEGSYRVKDGYITSCDLDKPHYKISSNNVLIYPDNEVIAKDVTINVGKVPVAYLPRYNYSLDTDWPTFHVTPGKKNRWGLFALTNYRYEIDENNKLTLRLDERENWGFAEGFDYKYAFNSFGEGLFKTYYTHQRERDRNETIKAEEERFRTQLRHRWNAS